MSDRIVVDRDILAGKPVMRGTRIAVESILELLAAGQSENEILASYPGLTRRDILACLAYASYLAHEYKAFPIPAWMRLLADGRYDCMGTSRLELGLHRQAVGGPSLIPTQG